jgi:hypothetical protein
MFMLDTLHPSYRVEECLNGHCCTGLRFKKEPAVWFSRRSRAHKAAARDDGELHTAACIVEDLKFLFNGAHNLSARLGLSEVSQSLSGSAGATAAPAPGKHCKSVPADPGPATAAAARRLQEGKSK